MLIQLFDTGESDLQTYFLVSLGFLLVAMVLVRSLYLLMAQFMFSPSFWLLVTYLFYFALKAVEIENKDAITPTLNKALWLSTLFLLTYGVMYAWIDASLRGRGARRRRVKLDIFIPRGVE
jgi:hypothetical protein